MPDVTAEINGRRVKLIETVTKRSGKYWRVRDSFGQVYDVKASEVKIVSISEVPQRR